MTTLLSVDALRYRLLAANIPGWGRDWTFETFTALADTDALQRRALATMLDWSVRAGHALPSGIVLWGPPGRGKTGLALAALRARIEVGDGNAFSWLTMAGAEVEQRIHAGLVTRTPGPLWFERWADLKARLVEARGFDDEGQARTARGLLRDLDRVTEVLLLDDIDQDGMSPWKEEQLLYLVERPLRQRRVLFTVNADMHEIVDRLGARIVDRLLDPHTYLLVGLGAGPSLRR